MKNETDTNGNAKKSFKWGISSDSINLLHLTELQVARDGSAVPCISLIHRSIEVKIKRDINLINSP